jgi:predicted acyl esterase
MKGRSGNRGSLTSGARTRRRRAVDAAVARIFKMPPGHHDYILTPGVRVTMRDGVELLTDIYAPVGKSLGTLLIRTPYGRTGLIALLTARYYATHGYAWALMTDPPPELAAAVIAISAHDNHLVTHGTGAFSLEPTLSVLDGFAHPEAGLVRGVLRLVTAGRRLKPGFEELPLVRAQETVLAGSSMPYREWLTSTNADDPVWRPMRLGQALERVNVPLLLHEGWQDRFVDQMIEQYERLHSRGVDVGLTIGPWTHVEVATKGAGIVMEETLDWLAEHLAGTGRRHRPSPVRIFVAGAQEWRYVPEWPPATNEQVLYLQPNGELGNTKPTPTAGPSTFIYDPVDPTPAVGGRVINPVIGGYRDNRELEKRDDVLTFTGPPLNEPLEVIGNPVVELVHRTDNPHADLFVRLCEVRKNGRSINVSDGFQRLKLEKSTGTILLRLDAMAHRFTPGTRIRLQISGGAHPRYARNLGTDEDPATSSTLVPSRRTIFHGDGGFSRFFLPCQLVDERDIVKY